MEKEVHGEERVWGTHEAVKGMMAVVFLGIGKSRGREIRRSRERERGKVRIKRRVGTRQVQQTGSFKRQGRSSRLCCVIDRHPVAQFDVPATVACDWLMDPMAACGCAVCTLL
jgi:hypothetical protein